MGGSTLTAHCSMHVLLQFPLMQNCQSLMYQCLLPMHGMFSPAACHKLHACLPQVGLLQGAACRSGCQDGRPHPGVLCQWGAAAHAAVSPADRSASQIGFAAGSQRCCLVQQHQQTDALKGLLEQAGAQLAGPVPASRLQQVEMHCNMQTHVEMLPERATWRQTTAGGP